MKFWFFFFKERKKCFAKYLEDTNTGILDCEHYANQNKLHGCALCEKLEPWFRWKTTEITE